MHDKDADHKSRFCCKCNSKIVYTFISIVEILLALTIWAIGYVVLHALSQDDRLAIFWAPNANLFLNASLFFCFPIAIVIGFLGLSHQLAVLLVPHVVIQVLAIGFFATQLGMFAFLIANRGVKDQKIRIVTESPLVQKMPEIGADNTWLWLSLSAFILSIILLLWFIDAMLAMYKSLLQLHQDEDDAYLEECADVVMPIPSDYQYQTHLRRPSMVPEGEGEILETLDDNFYALSVQSNAPPPKRHLKKMSSDMSFAGLPKSPF